MYKGFPEQMQMFALNLQKTMAEHIQSTMIKQMEVFAALQDPMLNRAHMLTSSLQNLTAEQLKLFSSHMHEPMAKQLQQFTGSMQRILSEQMQMFAAVTPNPTPEQVQEFLETIQDVVADQMNFADEVQGIMADQMKRFTENLQNEMTNVVGRGEQHD